MLRTTNSIYGRFSDVLTTFRRCFVKKLQAIWVRPFYELHSEKSARMSHLNDFEYSTQQLSLAFIV